MIQNRVLARAIEKRKAAVTGDELLRARASFMADKRLASTSALREWLDARGMDEALFEAQLLEILAFGKLKEEVAGHLIEPYFESHREEFAAAELDRQTRAVIYEKLFREWLEREVQRS